MLAGLITYTISAPVLFQFICLCPQNWKCFEYIKFLVLINLQEKRGGGSCFKSRRNDCRSACVFEHPLYDPSTEQLSLLQSLFEPMQLPSFLPVAASVPLKSVGRHKKKPIETIPWCETEAPLLFCSSFLVICLFSPLLFLPKVATAHYLILMSVLRRLLSLGPNPASELWYCVLLLFLWDN